MHFGFRSEWSRASDYNPFPFIILPILTVMWVAGIATKFKLQSKLIEGEQKKWRAMAGYQYVCYFTWLASSKQSQNFTWQTIESRKLALVLSFLSLSSRMRDFLSSKLCHQDSLFYIITQWQLKPAVSQPSTLSIDRHLKKSPCLKYIKNIPTFLLYAFCT